MDRAKLARSTAMTVAATLTTAFVVISLVVEVRGSMPGDEWVLRKLESTFGTGLDDAMVAVGSATNVVPLFVVAAVGAGALVAQRRRHDARLFLAIFVVGAAGNRILKEIFRRPRPDIRPHPESVSTFSFPSGHAASTMALFLAILVVFHSHRSQRAFLTVGAGAVALVGFSRLVVGVHYPSDILAGWLWVGAWSVLVRSRLGTARS